ncbi:unnamed protein product, partial [Symbiodinium sp. CCMP2592]
LSLFHKHLYQCSTSRFVPYAQQMVQQGLASVEGFLQLLIASYEEYWHDVGVPRHISSLNENLATVWNFDAMSMQRSPGSEHLQSLDHVYGIFKPRLAHVRWPTSQDFLHVQHVWPDQKEMHRQYKVLWNKVHLDRSHCEWRSPVECRASLVQPPAILLTCLGRKLQEVTPERRSVKAVNLTCLVFLIASFLWKPPSSFKVRPASVALLLRGGRLETGAFAMMTKAPFKQKLIFISEISWSLQPAAVAASFFLEKSMHQLTSRATGRRTHCWHAAFLLLASTTAQGASSVCERVGSLLHGLEKGESSIHPVIGGARDEAIVDTLVEAFRIKNPTIQRQAQHKRFERGSEVTGNPTLDRRVELSDLKASSYYLGPLERLQDEETAVGLEHLLKHAAEERARSEAVHRPVCLDAQTRSALMKVVTQRRGRLQVDTLPAFVRKGRNAAKTPLRSTGRKQMAEWLESEEGRQWRAQRDELLLGYCLGIHFCCRWQGVLLC